jgi:hypothetical protein
MIDVRGFYDLHLHSAPAPFARIGDSADIALWCAEAGMAGIVIKSHFESTVSKVHHARRAVAERYPDFRVFSSIALNLGVGGVNPGAVDLALQQGAKIVWLPTLDASNHVAQFGAAGSYGFAGMTVAGKRRTERHVITHGVDWSAAERPPPSGLPGRACLLRGADFADSLGRWAEANWNG